MPRSKRSKVVSLTQVSKRTKEQKQSLITQIQESADKWRYCWVFEVGAMRNTHLKTVRQLWKDSARLFFGRCSVMAKALGSTAEEEQKQGLHKIAQQLQGQVGLLFTDTEPTEVIEWFKDFKQPDFARSGNIASRDVTLPTGPVMQRHSDPPEPFPHNEEPQLRKLGLHTTMVKGVPTLSTPHKLCTKGKPLTSEQTQLLKLIGEKMVVFRVKLKSRWDSVTGEVVQIEGDDADDEGVVDGEGIIDGEGADEGEEDAMND